MRGAVLRVAAAVLLLAAVAYFVDLRKTLSLLTTVSPLIYGACALVLLAQNVVAALRWRRVAAACAVPIGIGAALRIFLIGQFFTQFLPSSIGGDAIRVVMVRGHAPSLAAAVSAVLNDRLIALAAAILLITLAVPVTASVVAPDPRWATIATAGLVGFYLAAALALAFGDRILALLGRIPLIAPILGILRDFLALCRGPSAPVVLGFSVVVHGMMVLAIGIAARGQGVSVTAWELAAVGPWIVVCSMLPISFGNWGVREASMVLGLGLVGVGVEHALAVSLTIAAGQLVVAVIGMLLWLAAGAPRAPAEQPTA